ncbi:MAG TPA: helix-hairpin-helix domain-containing protein [Pirellulales bacterium]|jgi:DNA polymerase (family 10)
MNNAEIAAAFDLIGDILEFQGANSFRVRAYRNASRTIQDLPEPIEKIVGDESRELTDIPGIGADLSAKITELVSTDRLKMLDELQAQVPASVLTLLRIPGLGPKKAATLHKELKVNSLDELKAACEAQLVRKLKGFGEKTEALIMAGLAFASSPEVERMYWAEADSYARLLLDHLNKGPGIRQIEMAGSYRRGRETIGDLDVLVDSDEPHAVMDRFAEFNGVETILGRGDTKMSVRLGNGLQIDLRIVPTESFGAALQYFTGSKEHNVVLRGMAKDRGLKINEYGVFRIIDSAAEKTEKSGRRKATKPAAKAATVEPAEAATDTGDNQPAVYIAGRTEEEVYATLDLPCFPPELRENRWEFGWAAEGKLPKLIETADIQGDLHMHTNATDGKATLPEMAASAQALGLKYIAITDHSKRVTMANGMTADRLRRQWEEIDKLNGTFSGFQILKGVECDILESGGMDLDDDCLGEADWVVASVHYGQKQPRAEITKRIVDALANPNVSAIAHPTGRILNRRQPYEVDLEAVYEAALKHSKFLELNSNPARLDLNDIHCAACRQRGIPIVVSTDAHSTAGLSVLRFGILQARRAGLTKADVANTRPWDQVKKLLGRG